MEVACSSTTRTQLPKFDQACGPTITLPASATARDFFELIFSDCIIDQIVAQTNIHALSNPPSSGYREWQDATPEMVRSFLGVVIAMGVKKYSATDDYWSTHPILGCPAISKAWTKRKYLACVHCLHLNDTSPALPRDHPDHDNLHNSRPVLDQVKRNCRDKFNPGRVNSIDEAMVAFKGRSTLKQYCPMKPVKRGYKVWARADSATGYMCDFAVYTGKDDSGRCVGLGAKVVKNLAEPLKSKGYCLVFDNYFSSVDLLQDLFNDGTGCVATTRADRKKWPQELKSLSLSRGQHKSVIVNKVQAFVWKDKKNVNFLNTMCDSQEMTTVKRKQKDGTSVDVTCPAAVAFYNKHMGGVDLHDHKRKLYSCSRKSQKWWPRLFYFLVDVAVVNAHILESLSPHHRKRPLKEFCLELAMEYLTLFMGRKQPRALPPVDPPESQLHWPSDRRNSRRRCAQCSKSGKEKRTYYECSVCNVGLCPECFEDYHRQ